MCCPAQPGDAIGTRSGHELEAGCSSTRSPEPRSTSTSPPTTRPTRALREHRHRRALLPGLRPRHSRAVRPSPRSTSRAASSSPSAARSASAWRSGLAPRWLAFRPILVGAQVALLGVVLGIVVGADHRPGSWTASSSSTSRCRSGARRSSPTCSSRPRCSVSRCRSSRRSTRSGARSRCRRSRRSGPDS